jgi:uncharacterized membrane protein
MNKEEFLRYLRHRLRRFPAAEVENAVSYYDELISERVRNERISEYEVVRSLGDPKLAAARCAAEMMADRKQPNAGKGALIILGICLSPVLMPFAIVVFTLYIVLFAVWISLVVSFGATAASALIGGLATIFLGFDPNITLAAVGGGLIAFSVLTALTVLTAKAGGRLIGSISTKTARVIMSRNKEVA